MGQSILRLGLIGLGGMAMIHARRFAAHPRVRVTLCCSRDVATGRAKAAELAGEHTTDAARVLEHRDLDAVMISTPNTLHLDTARQALEADKHVLVQYPIVQSVEQYDQLMALADQRRRVLLDILTPWHEPQPHAMLQALPRIGRVMSMHSLYVGGERESWYLDRDLRGNFFAALTLHNMVYYDLVMGCTPCWVQASLHEDVTLRRHSGVYMAGYPCGVIAVNEWHMGSCVPGDWQWRIEGSQGRLLFDRQGIGANAIRLQTDPSRQDLPLANHDAANEHVVDRFVAQVLDADDQPYAPRAYGRCLLQCCEAAQQAAREGTRVALASQRLT